MNTLAVVTRAYDAEAPYIKSFIEHYLSIGVKEFHIIIPQGNPHSFLLDELADYKEINLYIDYDFDDMDERVTAFNGLQNVTLKHIKTSHILSIDVDEFLDVSNVDSLLEHDYVRLNWVICPYTVYNDNVLYGFLDKQCKYIVRTNICTFISEHFAETKSPVKTFEVEGKLLHYVYRSFNDLYLKCSLGNYRSYQATQKQQFANGILDCKQLPLKFKMAAIYKRISDASLNKYECRKPNLCKVNTELEETLIAQTPYADIKNQLHQALFTYASRIDLPRFLKNMKKDDAYKTYGRLPHSKLAELADRTLMQEVNSVSWSQDKPSLFQIFRYFSNRF